MDYELIYNKIILSRINNIPSGYKEEHHIIPRSLGGTDTTDNLVYLTAREHFICHYLLTKIYEVGTMEWYKMHNAFIIMKAGSQLQNRYFNSRLYESRKKNFSLIMSNQQSGNKNSQFGTKWIYNELLKKSKKISVESEIPDGWKEGRKLKWDKTVNCKICDSIFEQKTKELFCSDECKQKANLPKFHGREEELITLYKKTKSLNKSLKLMGYPGAVSYYYDWAKKIIS